MKKFLSWKVAAILIVTLILGFFDLPSNIQTKILPFTPEAIQKSKIHLGLDLQGGSQLDYKVDLRKVAEADQEGIIEGVQTVIEKRVNALGVAEPNIYRANVGGETHIVVELAETAVLTQDDVTTYLGTEKVLAELNDDEKKLVSLEKAKATVGKTIQLEFKTQKTTVDPEEVAKIKKQAQETLDKLKGGTSFSVTGEEEKQANPGKVTYEKADFIFASDISTSIKDAITGLEVGSMSQELIETTGDYIIDETGQAVQNSSLVIVKLLDIKEAVKNKKEVDVSHILIAYKGLETADANVTRTEEEAEDLAKEVQAKAAKGDDFAALAKQYSDDASNKEDGGKLVGAVTGAGTYVYDFEQASLNLTKEGEVSEVVKTQFGYHIIKANALRVDAKEKQYQYEIISYSTRPDSWEATALNGEQFVHADVQLDQFFQPFVSIEFNDEGAKLFEEITGANIGKPIAIFVGGELISSPNVNEKISGGKATITGRFTTDEAKTLARDLNTGAIPAPIVLSGEYTLGATLGQEALDQSLWAGLIGILLVMLFMIIVYRLPGFVASLSLLMYGAIFVFLIKAQLNIYFSLLISLVIFAFLVIKTLNSKEPGWEKFLSFIISCFAFFFITFLLKSGVVVTLAGIAGIVMSFGIATDANILIFERLKEELKAGKTVTNAIDTAFNRAWTAIRDSNFSSLITCVILFYFGSSIIRGFAFNLAIGILVSMFTAITVTKTLLHAFISKKTGENLWLFGVRKKAQKTFEFIKTGKIWFGISGAVVAISIISILTFGLNLGIDFKGGSLMEFKFSEPVTKEQLTETLKGLEAEINADTSVPVAVNSTAEKPAEAQLATTEEAGTKLDFNTLTITETGTNGFIVKTKYIDSATHDKLTEKMIDKLPAFTEPRFTAIGPVVGKNLLGKAVIAIITALVMIIAYLAFAFRKVPKSIQAWKFGASCAIVAVVHDVIITTGVFALLGHYLHVEIDALFITAMLTVLGYSVNDTIVVFDRLREKLLQNPGAPLAETANDALNETVVRSFNTSFSVLLTLIAILIFGSHSIFYFVLALTIGMGIGTYSSIFTATPMLVWWAKKNDSKMNK
ncbi:MAG: protein translocase subunit SecF [Patescibacteria group bacterium]